MAKGEGYVYIMESGDLHKIGQTNNVGRRLSELQRTHPDVREIYSRKVPHVCNTEDALHGLFANRRVTGEWFAFKDGDLAIAINILDTLAGA